MRATEPSPDGITTVSVPALVRLGRAAGALPLKSHAIRASEGGGYLSPFKGRGMEYHESRPYQPGDDIRHLDWRVTARSARVHTKLYHEERERPVLVWVDQRAPMRFATRGRFKSVVAAECAALVGWSAVWHGDRIGGVVFGDGAHHELRPRRGRAAVLNVINHLASAPEGDPGARNGHTGVHALLRLRRITRPGSLVFLLSDFGRLDGAADAELLRLAGHSEIVLVFIHDPLERELPPPGSYRLTDGQGELHLDTADTAVRARYAARFAEHRERLLRLARRPNVHLVECATNADPLRALQLGLGPRSAA